MPAAEDSSAPSTSGLRSFRDGLSKFFGRHGSSKGSSLPPSAPDLSDAASEVSVPDVEKPDEEWEEVLSFSCGPVKDLPPSICDVPNLEDRTYSFLMSMPGEATAKPLSCPISRLRNDDMDGVTELEVKLISPEAGSEDQSKHASIFGIACIPTSTGEGVLRTCASEGQWYKRKESVACQSDGHEGNRTTYRDLKAGLEVNVERYEGRPTSTSIENFRDPGYVFQFGRRPGGELFQRKYHPPAMSEIEVSSVDSC